jgi:hypothetical protein
MQTYSSLFEKELAKLIVAEIERMQDVLSNGAATDYADYRHHVGIIQGLRRALEYCEDAQSIMSQR